MSISEATQRFSDAVQLVSVPVFVFASSRCAFFLRWEGGVKVGRRAFWLLRRASYLVADGGLEERVRSGSDRVSPRATNISPDVTRLQQAP
jgi:hypothetical protein